MSKIKVLITDGLAKDGVEPLTADGNYEIDLRKETPKDELEKIISQYQVIVIRSATTLTKELIEKGASLKLIVRAGAGVDNIDVKAASANGIPVMNTASANSLAAAELTIALLFAMFRQIPQAHYSLSQQKWERASFKGMEVTGKTLGVIGLGNIGRIVCEKAMGLGMRVNGYDPTLKSLSQLPQSLAKSDESFNLITNLDDILKTADVVTLHVPKTAETANLINEQKLGMMKTGSYLINCARGGIVDEKAVLAALTSGKLAGAAFDVFEKEPPVFPNAMFENNKVIFTPHLGASTVEAQERVAITAAKQMIAFFRSGDRTGVVN